jgi:hypothetical protein
MIIIICFETFLYPLKTYKDRQLYKLNMIMVESPQLCHQPMFGFIDQSYITRLLESNSLDVIE